jgi:hypothetical protein
MEDVGICRYYMVLWSIVRPIGIYNARLVYFGNLVYLFPFWYFVPRKIWQP